MGAHAQQADEDWPPLQRWHGEPLALAIAAHERTTGAAVWDETQRGWLAGDDYEWAAVHQVNGGDLVDRVDALAARADRLVAVADRLTRILAGRWEDDDPPGAPR